MLEPGSSPGGRRRLMAVVFLVAAALGLLTYGTGVLDRVEGDTIDARFGLRGTQPVDGVAVVAIDEDTLSEAGMTWPISRFEHAKMVDRLNAAGARVIVYDVQFTEPSADPEADLALFESLGRAGGAILATGESDDAGRTAVLGGDENLAEVQSRAAAGNLDADPGGVIRRYLRAEGRLASLAMATAERLDDVPRGGFHDGTAWIDFRGQPGTIPTYSFRDVAAGRVGARELRGQVVVVGGSAATIQDVHPVPTSGSRQMAGPEVQANAIWTALNDNPLRGVPGWVDALLVLLMAAVAPVLSLRLGYGRVVIAAVVLAVAFAVVAQLAFGGGVIIAVVAPLLALVAGTVGTVVTAYLIESRERRWVTTYSRRLEAEVRARTADLRESQLEVVRRLARAAESRDDDTGAHIERMSDLCSQLGVEAGFDAARADLIRHAAVLHDIGKIAVPDAVLLKPGRLDPDERRIMETHAEAGAAMIAGSASPLLQLGEVIARTHHERWDGTGYPNGLRGEDIPIEGRIAALCDVFDALMSPRPYKKAWAWEEVTAELLDKAGSQFDPELTALFVAMVDRHRATLEPRYTAAAAAYPAPPALASEAAGGV